MSDKLPVQISSTRIQMEPGGTPFELALTLQNLADVVDQYTVEISGLNQEWYTAPVTSLSLFPQDQEKVHISLHPPKGPDVKAGTYPFRVIARSRGGAEGSADATLEVRGAAVYRLDITPRRQTARGEGKYQLQLVNRGDADVYLSLEARDARSACKVSLGDEGPTVRAGSKVEIPVVVRPDKRPWVGDDESYDFTITARPLDAVGETQTIAAQFTHHPPFRSWAPVRTVAIVAVFAIALLVVVGAILSSGFVEAVPQRVGSAMGSLKGAPCGVPVLGGLCPRGETETLAAQSLPTEGPCTFDFGFKEFAAAEPKLIGECTSNVAYDAFGNGVQYTKVGTLFWQKESNTVYFFRGNSLWAFVEGHTQLLRGSGAT